MTYLKNDSRFDEMMELIMQHGLPGMRQATEVLLNEVMKMQRTDHLRAEPYERSEFRLDYAKQKFTGKGFSNLWANEVCLV